MIDPLPTIGMDVPLFLIIILDLKILSMKENEFSLPLIWLLQPLSKYETSRLPYSPMLHMMNVVGLFFHPHSHQLHFHFALTGLLSFSSIHLHNAQIYGTNKTLQFSY